MTGSPRIEDLVKAAIDDPNRPEILPQYEAEGVEYVNARTKVPVWCREHGTFWLLPRDIERRSYLCKKCHVEFNDRDRQVKEADLAARIRKKFGDNAFDLSKLGYKNTQSPVSVICNKHNTSHSFLPYDLDKITYLCTDCRDEGLRSRFQASPETFIEKARALHGKRYGYDKVVYSGSHKKVVIQCKEHGAFEQTPASHLNGRGCPECGKEQSALKKRTNV